MWFVGAAKWTGAELQHEYRGHRIRLIAAERWTAEFTELATGTLLPTKIIATPQESLAEVAARARRLVDIYLDSPVRARRVLGPARPWQTIFEAEPVSAA